MRFFIFSYIPPYFVYLPKVDAPFGLLLDAIEKSTEIIYNLILKKDLEQLKSIFYGMI